MIWLLKGLRHYQQSFSKCFTFLLLVAISSPLFFPILLDILCKQHHYVLEDLMNTPISGQTMLIVPFFTFEEIPTLVWQISDEGLIDLILDCARATTRKFLEEFAHKHYYKVWWYQRKTTWEKTGSFDKRGWFKGNHSIVTGYQAWPA